MTEAGCTPRCPWVRCPPEPRSVAPRCRPEGHGGGSNVNQRTGAVDIRRGILAAFVAAVALLLFSVPRGAGADSGTTESLRSRAAQVMADMDRLDARRDAAVAAQRRARVRLTAARETLAQTEIKISAAESTVHAAEQRLADTLVAAYKRSDGGSTTGYLLGAASFSDLINRVDVVDR